MTPARRTTALALALAQRTEGVTAGELADVAGLTLRGAQKALAALATDGFLSVEIQPRKGRRRGDWRSVYRLAGGDHGQGSR